MRLNIHILFEVSFNIIHRKEQSYVAELIF